MRSEKDVESYLLSLKRPFRTLEDQPGTFLVQTEASSLAVAVRVDPPLVVVRVHIGEIAPASDATTLYRRLLELNAKQLVHASYGLDEGSIVLSSALELENLDFNELQATLDEIDLALAQQLPELARMARGGDGSQQAASSERSSRKGSA